MNNQHQNGLGGGHHPQFHVPNNSPFAPYFAAAAAAAHYGSPGFGSPQQPPQGMNLSGSSSSSGGNTSSGSSSGGSANGSLNMSPPEELSKAEKMTRATQYKKIMKPLLERKRRARINKCLDELKDIMTAALQAQGENVSKLEKADILELTVRHLHKMQQARRLMTTSRNPLEEIQRFQAGYSSCAQEAASFLLSTPGVDITVGQRLLAHLSTNMANPIASALQTSRATQPLPPAMPLSSTPVTAASRSSNESSSTTPLRRSSSPTMSSPSKRLFHSPPLTSSRGSPQPPRPSSTPANNNNYSVTVSITRAASEDEDGSPRMPIKPAPIRLNPNDPVWRPF